MSILNYETFGQYELILNFCPFIRHTKIGSIECTKCQFFISKNKKLKTVRCSFQDKEKML